MLAAVLKSHPGFDALHDKAPLPTASSEDLKAFGDRLDDELEHMQFTRDHGDIGAQAYFDITKEAENTQKDNDTQQTRLTNIKQGNQTQHK